MAGQVRKDEVYGAGDDYRAGRQAIEAVGEVDGIGRADNDGEGENNVKPAEIGPQGLEEGNTEVAVKVGVAVEDNSEEYGACQLVEQLAPGTQAPAVFLCYFLEVIIGADGAEPERNREDESDIAVGKVCPEQGGVDHGEDDQHAAHCRDTFLLQVGLRTVFPNHLAELQFFDVTDKGGGNQDKEKESGYSGTNGPERDVAEHIEPCKEVVERV